MFNVVVSAICRTASSLLWPATGMEGQESWRTFRLPEAVESVVVKRMFSSYSLKSSHLPSVPAPRSPDLDIDKDLSSSRLTTMAFRLAFARASTSATLVHVDINLISQRSQQKATTETFKCAESVDSLPGHHLSKPAAQIRNGELDQGPPIVKVVPLLAPVQRRRGNKRATKSVAARWVPNPLERVSPVARAIQDTG